MNALNGRSGLAGSRLAHCCRGLLEAVAAFRLRWARKGPGGVRGGLASTADERRPLFDNAVIAAACECPSLALELLVVRESPDGCGFHVPNDEATSPTE